MYDGGRAETDEICCCMNASRESMYIWAVGWASHTHTHTHRQWSRSPNKAQVTPVCPRLLWRLGYFTRPRMPGCSSPGWRKEVSGNVSQGPGAARWSYLASYNLTHTLADGHRYVRTCLDRRQTPTSVRKSATARCPSSLSHVNSLMRPYLAFVLMLLSHS